MNNSGYTDDFFQDYNMGAGTSMDGMSSSYNRWAMNSYFLRGAYTYNDRYSATVTARIDGSSKFGKDNKYAFFPSAGLAWNVSNEDFMKDIETVSNLKLHTSYGLTGNSEIDPYTSLGRVSSGTLLQNGGYTPYTYISNLGNSSLKWEKTAQWDFGFNLGLFKNRLNFDISYYYKKTTDLLLGRPVPYLTGFTSVMDNIGSVQNKGVDIMVTATPVQSKDFSWNATLNMQPVEGEDETPQQLYEHYRFVADRGQTLLRVDKFLVDRMTGATRNRIQMAADAGCIMANGRPVKSNYRVKPEDVVTIMMTRPPRTFEVLPENIPIKIIYEDEDLLVVDKPAGLVVHPGHGNYTGTLVNALAWYLKDDPTYDPNDPDIGLVHRIDKNTSGLLVVAKKPESKERLSMQFFRKTTQREYRALVWGIVKEDEGRIEGNIGRDPHNRMQMTVFPEGDQGKTAVTHYKVLERLGYVTLVKCRLETGRTHQIRVHMKYIGHTLFNDERYGGNEILKGVTTAKYKQFVENCFAICPRQALHAKTLGFIHPTTGEEMFFDSEIPDDMTQLINKWRNYANSKEL